MSCECTILLNDNEEIKDITIGLPIGPAPANLPAKASFKFESLVETARIPLHLSLGSPCPVSTTSDHTERWFRQVLLNSELDGERRWWETARVDSPLGVLVSVPAFNDGSQVSRPRVTEILFYLSRDNDPNGRPPTPPPPSLATDGPALKHEKSRPVLSVYALALSSDLLHHSVIPGPTPPASPDRQNVEIEAVFLPQPFLDETQPVNQPPVLKRKSAVDVFDEANERHKKARRKGGEGVSAAAAAPKAESQIPTLQHRRSSSMTQPVQPHTRPLSRSPSLAPSRPATAASSGARKSTLSRMQSAAEASDVPDIESKNKDVISRIVMAGMRLYGLSQSKRRKSRAGSAAPSPFADDDLDKQEAERQSKDEEFKLIYHQVFKGTCLAFRAVLGTQLLHTFPDAIRDVADRLLSIFCSDPLAKDERGAFQTELAAANPVL